MFAAIFIICAAILLVGYKFYGDFMAGVYELDNSKETPAVRLNDDIDYVPTHPAVLMGHHFSSIAGAGPITGPIIASGWFGWVPTLFWCMLGCVFFGGPHDMGALVASIRHDGNSIGTVVEKWIGRTGKKLFLWFTILTLILVVAVFQAMTTGTFVADPAVAFVSILYIVLAVISGILIYRFNVNFKAITLVALAIVAYCAWNSGDWAFVNTYFAQSAGFWNWTLAIYILLASTLPVWLLLQPRDYLSSFFLYFAVIVGAVGMIFGSGLNTGTIPAFASEIKYLGFSSKALWPCLFTTVACGAISGFHSLVSSGTTGKQIAHEKDAVPIGYGAMLLEGMVAVIAVGCLMAAGKVEGGPMGAFATGFGKFCGILGIEPAKGTRLGFIAINTFLLTSLDTATRLCRYQIQELSDQKINKWYATVIPVLLACVLVFMKATVGGKPVAAWQIIWPVFGASNQLVAAIALLAIAAWIVKGLKKNAGFIIYPFWFMLATSVFALVINIHGQLTAEHGNVVLVVLSAILIVLAALLVKEGLKAINEK